jgi:hypothetical protein
MCIHRVPSENSPAFLSDSAESESTLALCFIAFSWCEPVSTSLENALGGGVLPQGTQSKIAAEINPARAVHGPISILAVFSKKRGRLAVTVPSARKNRRRCSPQCPSQAKQGPNFWKPYLQHDLQKSCDIFGEGHATKQSDRDHERSSVKRSWSRPRSRPKPKGVAISTAKAGHPPASRKSS